MKRTIVVGTRQSTLAMTQTYWVVERLKELSIKLNLEIHFEVRKIITRGDLILDVALPQVGGKSLFTKELEEGMLKGDIDLAVHSLKDMPFDLPHGLQIGAVPEREDPRDALISKIAKSIEELPQCAHIGTSSPRRTSQILNIRPDLRISAIRGNIDSRVQKFESEGFDAIILAAAGLKRIGFIDQIAAFLPPDRFVPAVGQGALAVECRTDDDFVLKLLHKFQHEHTSLAVIAERSFLGSLGGGCHVPLGAYATVQSKNSETKPLIQLTGFVGLPNGELLLKETREGSNAELLGQDLAACLVERGARNILVK